MTTSYPSSKQTINTYAGTALMSGIDHAGWHGMTNDTVMAIEDVLGTTSGTSVLKNFTAGDFCAKTTDIPSVPISSGTAINAGTSNSEFTTPKNIADSNIAFLNDIPNILENGWSPLTETWIYVSSDDPTGVFKVQADVTNKYSSGMKIKMTNNSNLIYGFITKVGTYGGNESGYTYITFLHEIDPSNSLALHLITNNSITLNYYSTQRSPFGFPLSPNKWNFYVGSTSGKSVTSPDNTFKQFGDLSINIPIGSWKINFKGSLNFEKTATHYVGCYVALSTSSSSVTDVNMVEFHYIDLVSSDGNRAVYEPVNISHPIDITSKTTYYVIGAGYDNNISSLNLAGNFEKTIIEAVCAYL